MMKLTEVEEECQYLLLTTAAAVRARLQNADRIDYTIDRLTRVVNRATEVGQNEIAVIAQSQLDVARRLKEQGSDQQAGWSRRARVKPRAEGEHIVIGDDPESALELTYAEANSLQSNLRELLVSAGITMRDAF